MISIKRKSFESKIVKSKYPNCELEIIYYPDNPELIDSKKLLNKINIQSKD